MGPVENALVWATYTVELKQYCYVSSSAHDTILERFMKAAGRHADEYLHNPFTEQQAKITLDDVQAGEALTIDGAIFTAAAADDETEREFKVGVSDTEDAVALLALVNSDVVGGTYGSIGVETVIGTSVAGLVTLTHRYPNEKPISASSSDEDQLRVSLTRVALDIPSEVLVWCWQFVAWKFENRDGRKSERAEMGITSVDWGDGPDETLLEPYVRHLLEIV